MIQPAAQSRRMIRWIMLAVFLWGGTLSLGALLFGYDQQTREVTLAPNPLRGLIVLACVCAFLGFWGLSLRSQSRKKATNSSDSLDSDHNDRSNNSTHPQP